MKKFFILLAFNFHCFSMENSQNFSHNAKIIEHYEKTLKGNALTIKKVTQKEDLEAFDEKYFDKLDYTLNSPFGVYVAYETYETETLEPVGIESFCGWIDEKKQCLVASPETDVLENYQGRGYGTVLRSCTAKYISQFFGEKVEETETGKLSELPLSHISAANEWDFGQNYPSLKSELDAGYGIIAITYGGNLDMVYPKNSTMWHENRVKKICDFSKIMMNPKSDLVDKAVEHINYLLHDLDYTKEADIITLLSTACSVIQGPSYKISLEKKEEEIEIEIKIINEIYQKIYEESLCKVFKQLNNDQLNLIKAFVTQHNNPSYHRFKDVLEDFLMVFSSSQNTQKV